MNIIQKVQGCPPGGKTVGCMGPVGDFYVVFGSELRFLTNHIIVSASTGILVLIILFYLRKNRKIVLPIYSIPLLSILISAVLFFVLAYIFPVEVYY